MQYTWPTYALMALMISSSCISHGAVPVEQGNLSGVNQLSLPQSNMPQNSIPKNSAVSATNESTVQGSNLWQLYQQVQQMQQEIRELRGQLEAQQDINERLQKDLKNRYTDLDQRLENLKEQTDKATTEAETKTAPPDVGSDSDPATPAELAQRSPLQLQKQRDPLTELKNKSQPKASAITASSQSDAISKPSRTSASNHNAKPPKMPVQSEHNDTFTNQPTATVTSSKAEKTAYNDAYEAYKTGGAAKAIAPMQAFIKKYPASPLIPNAHYWLGEFYLALTPILLIVYAAFSQAINQGLWHQVSLLSLISLIIVCCVLLAIVMLLLTYASRALGFNKEDEIAIVFCGSKKTLASGLPMAKILFSQQPIGMLILPLMLFHQIQLIVCAILAAHYAKRLNKI